MSRPALTPASLTELLGRAVVSVSVAPLGEPWRTAVDSVDVVFADGGVVARFPRHLAALPDRPCARGRRGALPRSSQASTVRLSVLTPNVRRADR